jgi:antitoxin (DNA-binding transcriptional repressor) of toxin-antitoxin stability system
MWLYHASWRPATKEKVRMSEIPDGAELTVSELRANLPTILHRTLVHGESFLILKHGHPFARLSPLTEDEGRAHYEQMVKETGKRVTVSMDVSPPAEAVLT